MDAGNSIRQVQNELRELQQEAGRTEKKFEGLQVGLENVIGGLAAGGGIATAIEKAMDMSKLKQRSISHLMFRSPLKISRGSY